jgi:hypothetical protein
MKAQMIDSRSFDTRSTGGYGAQPTLARGLLAQARGLEILATLATRAAIALIPALTIVVAAALAVATPDMAVYLQATLWACGFVFIALAMESDSPAGAGINLAIGIALPVLTWLSARLASELAVAAAALVAAWLAVAIFRRF